MAPVLFLFLMSAAVEMLESEWKQAGIEELTMAHTPDNELDTGYEQGHTPRMYTSRELAAYEIYQLLYVNNGAFPFPTRAALIKGLTLVHSHLARFGLEVLGEVRMNVRVLVLGSTSTHECESTGAREY
jgi:hypothetical protein